YLGFAGGCLLAAVQGHPRRMLGLVPWAEIGFVVGLAWSAAEPEAHPALLLLGVMAGLMLVPLRTNYQLTMPAEIRSNGMALMIAVEALVTLSALGFVWLKRTEQVPATSTWLLVSLAVAGALVAWRVLLREAIEQLGEIILWPMYRVAARGP